MAFRTSVKALLLADEPEPPPRAASIAAARETLAERPPERPRLPDPVVPPPAPPRATEAAPPVADSAPLVPAWPARAAAIRAMAPQLPSAANSQLMLKIAALYDELAAEAALAPSAEASAAPDVAPATLAADDPQAADAAADDAPLEEEELPPDDPALRVPPLAAPAAFPRRALPGRRAGSLLRR